MNGPAAGGQANPLLALLDLGHRARAAAGSEELAFLLANDTRALLPYRQAALWFADGGVRTLSGVTQADRNAPYVQWLEKVCRVLTEAPSAPGVRVVGPDGLPPELAAEWNEWLPAFSVWVPLPADEARGERPGGLLVAGDLPLDGQTLALLGEWADIWLHAWRAKHRPATAGLAAWWRRGATPDRPWWKRRGAKIALGVLALLLLPVRLSVLAPGELVAANPAVIRAPLDGVIGQFHVRPNQLVKAGEALFGFDEGPIASRLEVARQALATAEAEYRQFAQLALSDPKSKNQLAALLGKIGEKRAEEAFLASQFERTRVLAPQDGVAIFDDPAEWVGRPVQTGERVMRIARPDDVEIEAWIPIGDAIPLDEGAEVSLYLAASPFAPVEGRLRYLTHDAIARPDGSHAYRARALVEAPAGRRIGLKGTVKLRGGWVPFGYWMMRRPLATIRQFVAI
ncbi:MAG: HlyD family efflux transporter periplasmic adaptor subunit [Proteobacteria bacterium]|nr:HlyD family efflux transporter periplasmic adaptor subunit [Pseudomonadota bacterium]